MHLINVDGCMHVAGGVVVSSDGGRGVVVGGVGSGVVVAGAHMSGFMTHLQHESKRCLQQTSDPLQRKKSHVQSAKTLAGLLPPNPEKPSLPDASQVSPPPDDDAELRPRPWYPRRMAASQDPIKRRAERSANGV